MSLGIEAVPDKFNDGAYRIVTVSDPDYIVVLSIDVEAVHVSSIAYDSDRRCQQAT
ncbi:hypothetical protein GOACH_22_00510 [Gordonia aichiensis NBRC 108223]|uniref:Uncharacterized protein n=1 Tax=Gordonia aichiensis NBRC 108223 TaxID=1220583 RepID=L7KRA2_9ACTN|nr:hypothetical protein GOACH_22_00510 [Gordonia aichiensis NBRC 108223]